MTRYWLASITLAVLVGCSGSSPTAPAAVGGGNTGGNSGGDTDGAPPLAVAIAVGNNFFRSGHNQSASPAVDTVAAGGTVTWTWTNSGSVPHSVESVSSPSFTSSAIQIGDGSRYSIQFSAPGTYRYDCAVHGRMMSGTIVVR
jgi:plastocyanin